MAAQPASPTLAIALYLRLWMTAETGSLKPPPAWDDGTELIKLLREILCFHGGVPSSVPDTHGLLLAHFADQRQAVRVARQVQALMTGFAGMAEPQAVAVTLAIFHPLRDRDDAADLLAYLQQRAQPAQILFAFLSDDPALPVSAFRTQALSSSGRVQLSELVWRYKDRVAAAALQAHARATKQRQGVPLSPALQRRPIAPRLSLKDFSRNLRANMELSLRTINTKLSGWATKTSVDAAAPSGQLVFLSFRRWISLAAAFVLLCIMLLLVHRRSPTAAVLVTPTATVPAANAVQTTTAAVTGKSSTAPLPAVPELPVSAVSMSEKRGAARPEQKKKTRTDEEPERIVREHGGLSSEQTRQVLSRGQTQLDQGCYALAIAYFRRVLEDDPHNISASSGIEKSRKRLQLDTMPKAACH